MERLKDFFHDYSDMFLALFVAGIMFFAISWNLGSWFDNSSNTALANNTPVIEQEKPEKDSTVTDDPQGSEEENSSNENKEDENAIDSENTENAPKENTVAEEKPPVVAEVKTITVPNGTPGTGVANILKENGLIQNTNDFIQAAERLNLAVRLKSGTFEISTDATVEDMVKIIAGQKK
ncbi:MltG/YceG/YrrL family protein [Alkaliphilus oremlandii]|uniref:Aminodeoxychorismate lyase n=1 Tax=Alkaliphilus oremlandii (strain OhILAs) TaxID=350688 RepID=A8MIB7_ALKOO|nr:hypothetical protein [Alkaliphilus oremlandii]ABW19549.1 hypothetical protein Clos_2012 [Alkaliphilus oremlandii OhILAs]